MSVRSTEFHSNINRRPSSMMGIEPVPKIGHEYISLVIDDPNCETEYPLDYQLYKSSFHNDLLLSISECFNLPFIHSFVPKNSNSRVFDLVSLISEGIGISGDKNYYLRTYLPDDGPFRSTLYLGGSLVSNIFKPNKGPESDFSDLFNMFVRRFEAPTDNILSNGVIIVDGKIETLGIEFDLEDEGIPNGRRDVRTLVIDYDYYVSEILDMWTDDDY